MKRFLIATLLIFCLMGKGFAQHLSFACKPLDTYGFNMKLSFSFDGENTYLNASMESIDLLYAQEPYILIKTVDEQVIKLTGTVTGSTSESVGVPIGGMIFSETEHTYNAQFPITEQQLALLNEQGIAKIRVGTMPKVHDKKFGKRERFGQKLYKVYLKTKAKYEAF